MDLTTQPTLDEIWWMVGAKVVDDLPEQVKPRFGVLHLELTIHEYELVKARGWSECVVKRQENSGES